MINNKARKMKPRKNIEKMFLLTKADLKEFKKIKWHNCGADWKGDIVKLKGKKPFCRLCGKEI